MATFKNDWEGYFVCPNCKRIHSWEKVKKTIVWRSGRMNFHSGIFDGGDCTEFRCIYCKGLFCGHERRGCSARMYNSQGDIEEYRYFISTGRVTYTYKKVVDK